MADSSRPDWEAAARIAAQQWGNATTSQLSRCGCSGDVLTAAVDSGRIFRPHLGVYSVGRPPTTGHEVAMAAVLAGGSGALLSHLWTVWLFGLGRLPSSWPDVSVPRSRRGRQGIVFHRRRVMPEPDMNFGIPCTTPAQTLADCATLLTPKQLRRAVNQAQIQRLTTAEKLMTDAATRDLVSEHGATRSLLEELLLDLTHAHGLPAPLINHDVHGVEVDFYYPDLRRVIEADGYSFHFTKIAFEDDHERRLYLEARGERVTVVDYAQVTKRRRTTADRLTEILQPADSIARP